MESELVTARVNERVHGWLVELAEEKDTTIERIAEDKLREAYQEESKESLPKGVFHPESDEYSYGVKWSDVNGKTQREYYENRADAEDKAARVRDGPRKMMLLSTES